MFSIFRSNNKTARNVNRQTDKTPDIISVNKKKNLNLKNIFKRNKSNPNKHQSQENLLNPWDALTTVQPRKRPNVTAQPLFLVAEPELELTESENEISNDPAPQRRGAVAAPSTTSAAASVHNRNPLLDKPNEKLESSLSSQVARPASDHAGPSQPQQRQETTFRRLVRADGVEDLPLDLEEAKNRIAELLQSPNFDYNKIAFDQKATNFYNKCEEEIVLEVLYEKYAGEKPQFATIQNLGMLHAKHMNYIIKDIKCNGNEAKSIYVLANKMHLPREIGKLIRNFPL